MNLKHKTKYPYTVLDIGSNGCGKPAFYLRHKLGFGDLIKSSNVVWLDGKPTQSGDIIKCGSCGNYMNNISFRAIIKTAYPDANVS